MRIGFFLLFLAVSFVSQAQVLINEVCATNGDIVYDSTYFNYSNWIEIYNAGPAPVNIGGYFLSDSPTNPTRWAFPSGTIINPNSYLLVWCDDRDNGLHTSFEIEPNGDELVLSLPSGEIIDQVAYEDQHVNISYARTTDGGPAWNFSSTPTPGKANVGGTVASVLSPVQFGLPSGRYSGSATINLVQAQANEIRYTTDGSEPTSQSSIFNSFVNLTQTTVLKAKAFHPDFLPSETVSATYFIDEHIFTLPVVSLSADPRYLWNDTIGIYVQGINGIQKYCSTFPANWNQDWQRHGVFEYLNPSGESNLQQHLTFEIAGNCTRRRDQKSFAFKAKQEFGSGKIRYPLFDSKPIQRYDEIFLRNAGNDNNVTHFRDAFLQTLPQGFMDVDYLAYQPVSLYINGQYWGIENMREKGNGDYIENNYGIPKEDIDLIENYNSVVAGSSSYWFDFLDSLEQISPLDPTAFQYLDKNIDVQEYINYLVLQIYYANSDWANNIKFWRQRSTSGKFRWILWDTDFGFGLFPDQADYTHPTLDYATAVASTGDNTPNFTKPIRLVMAIPEFRNKFIATLATAMGTTFEPSRVVNVIDQFSNRLQAEMPYHKQRWGGTMTNWNSEVQELRDFAFARHTFMQNYVSTFFGLDQVGLSASITPAQTGSLEVNGVVANTITFAPFYSGVPYTLKATPKPGFQFSHWTIATRPGSVVNLASPGDVWRFYDLGSLPASDWKSYDYNDASWSQGASQLGYGDGDEQTVVSFGSSSSNKFTTTYFRRSFDIVDTAQVFNLSGSVLYDDGVVVYVNGNEVFRGNMPAGTITNSTFASANKADENLYQGFSIPKIFLRNGSNTISAEVHQFNLTSSDLSFDLKASMFEYGAPDIETVYEAVVYDTAISSVEAVATFVSAQTINTLIINEIGAAPSGVLDEQHEESDWIELYNNGAQAIHLNGLFITDDASRKTKFHLKSPEGEWLLEPGAYALLWADDDESDGANHLSFKLSDEGEGVYIYQQVGFDTLLIAFHEFGKQPNGFSLARIPNVTGAFEHTYRKTPGSANKQIPAITELVINEFSATPTSFTDEQGEQEDWIELFNTSSSAIELAGLFITDDPEDKFKHFITNEVQTWELAAGGYQIVVADEPETAAINHLSFRLSGSGEKIAIYQLTGGDTVQVALTSYGEQLRGFSSARIPNGTGNFVSTFAVTPGAINKEMEPVMGLVLNEISALPSSAIDEQGDHDDWLELFNAGDSPIDLSGLFITDDGDVKLKHLLDNKGQPWLLPPGGYQLLWADEELEEGQNHIDFKLSSAGDQVGMYQVTGGDTVQLIYEAFPFQSPGYSLARIPNGTGPFTLTSKITAAATNEGLSNALILYPNPAQNTVKILLEEENAAVSFFDVLGEVTHTFRFTTPHEAALDVSTWPSGYYFLRIQYPTRSISSTLIIAR
jgi:hypothetical protein